MPNDIAISIEGLSQSYKLFEGPGQMFLDSVGIYKWLPWRRPILLKNALDNIDLTIRRGERVGILGRNGAGKTTLLKLLTGNFQATKGKVTVNGTIQSLMSSGLGFHPDLTGRENVKAALVFNNLSSKQMAHAIDDIIDFAELDIYLDQPFKTYSLGMQARLAFATSTAIHPDILIIDEVMGAGDAYFATKSAQRMKELTKTGTTLLLVSHSMPQIMQFCERAVWLHEGRIRTEGSALEIVKQYHKYIIDLEQERLFKRNEEKIEQLERLAASEDASQLSRWLKPEAVFRIDAFDILNDQKQPQTVFKRGDDLLFRTRIRRASDSDSKSNGHLALNLFAADGVQIALLHTPFAFTAGAKSIEITCRLPKNFLGNHSYVLTVGVYENLYIADVIEGTFSEIWDRSFEFKIDDEQKGNVSVMYPVHEWHHGHS